MREEAVSAAGRGIRGPSSPVASSTAEHGDAAFGSRSWRSARRATPGRRMRAFVPAPRWCSSASIVVLRSSRTRLACVSAWRHREPRSAYLARGATVRGRGHRTGFHPRLDLCLSAPPRNRLHDSAGANGSVAGPRGEPRDTAARRHDSRRRRGARARVRRAVKDTKNERPWRRGARTHRDASKSATTTRVGCAGAALDGADVHTIERA